jgi:hypothetical protein
VCDRREERYDDVDNVHTMARMTGGSDSRITPRSYMTTQDRSHELSWFLEMS